MIFWDNKFLVSRLILLTNEVTIVAIDNAVLLAVYEQRRYFAVADRLQTDLKWIELEFRAVFLGHF
jgi:hypothetical protein